MAMAIHYLMLAFEASRESERRVLHSEVSTREAELRALRAQLNPHFLFNSLNSINALVGSDPEGARRMCESLGDFLRRTLALGSRDAVTLNEELSLVDRYYEIESVRFGERLRMERFIETGAERCLVPPLLLQPLVENAVTHGVAHVLEGGTVRVRAHRRGSGLTITVDNPCDPDRPPGRGTGLGLRNVRERLDSAYGSDAFVTTEERDGRFVVTLEMPSNE